ncbi:MAG: translation elongation factor Ts [Planctomycetaceae bacterium]|nr:translation elongation factor Ts [Planctomycetales bacterium]MCB9921290.1 translation elongation factor Ts [Planctomycetaceae bacterium]
MAAITAAAVKALREKTSLPLMDCKKALTECDGNEEAAVQWLRERGLKVMGGRTDRETAFGRFGIYAGTDKAVGAIVELKCESDPVAKNDEFVQLANDLAEQLANGPGATTVEELLAQPSPSKKSQTLGEQRDDLMNKIREVFNVGRLQRLDGATGGYSHNAGTIAGVLTAVKGGNDEAAKDVCMHIAAMRPAALTVQDLDPAEVEKERAILREAALQEGKPENIVDKMVEGRLRSYYAERVLLEQPFVKEPKQSVGQYAKENSMEVSQFIHWVLGE